MIFALVGFDLDSIEIQQCLQNIGISDQRESITLGEFIQIASPYIRNRNPENELNELFDLFDEDQTGVVSFQSLKRVAREVGLDYSDEELQEMIDEADRDGDGVLCKAEFRRVLKRGGDGTGRPTTSTLEDSSDEEEC